MKLQKKMKRISLSALAWYTNGRGGREVPIACLLDRANEQTIEEVSYVRV